MKGDNNVDRDDIWRDLFFKIYQFTRCFKFCLGFDKLISR
ncbi:MAG: hypothetical protein RLZZ540_368 [Bacteroidota bacterium]|jgi:hypothetical protein